MLGSLQRLNRHIYLISRPKTRSYHPLPFLGLAYKKMPSIATSEPAVGQTRRHTDDVEDLSIQPPEKKIRIEVEPAIAPALVAKPTKHAVRKQKKRIDKMHAPPEPYSTEDVLWHEVIDLLGKELVDEAVKDLTELDAPFELYTEVVLKITAISSNGTGLGISPEPLRPWVVVVPFTLPGEEVRAKLYRHGRMHSLADLVEVITPHPLRDPGRIQCKYFGTCAGCQYQMLSYEKQLDLKRDVIVKAYKTFSDLPESSVPTVDTTLASPLQYAYRTKITPHFDLPPAARARHKKNGPNSKPQAVAVASTTEKPDWLNIGFNKVGTRNVLDIEDCPIATPVLNEGYREIRKQIIANANNYTKGVTLSLRDSLDTSIPLASSSDLSDKISPTPIESEDSELSSLSGLLEKHVCVSDQKARVREKVGDVIFEYGANSFFQNNNSVLIPLVDYVRGRILSFSGEAPTHLVDAYCGSGLFAISLSPHFSTVAGIELSDESIRSARRIVDLEINKIPKGKCTFHAGDASNIFASVRDFPSEQTVVLIDPPRKGTDDVFLKQLLEFKPKTVVYVSCNVHTQARDIGKILKDEGSNYVLESLKGFDLFPQTAHVESVAVLRLA